MPRYRVSGPLRVFGHEPGSEFERDIPKAQEARKLASGSLTRVAPSYTRRPGFASPPAPSGAKQRRKKQ